MIKNSLRYRHSRIQDSDRAGRGRRDAHKGRSYPERTHERRLSVRAPKGIGVKSERRGARGAYEEGHDVGWDHGEGDAGAVLSRAVLAHPVCASIVFRRLRKKADEGKRTAALTPSPRVI